MNAKIEKIESKIRRLQNRIRFLVAVKKVVVAREKMRRKQGAAHAG